MDRVLICDSPGSCSRKELASIAFREVGIYDDDAFETYWEKYQEFLVEKLLQETEYLGKMLEKECQQGARKHTKHLRDSVLFMLGFVLGVLLSLLLGLQLVF